MTRRDLAELLLLAALWGGSFLFMRVGAGEFGPAALLFVRVAGAAALLLPIALARGEGGALRRHWRELAVVGLLNSALPFACYMVAALVLSAGLAAILNATTPLWTALIAWAWLGDRPGRVRAVGLAVGFAGVVAVGLQNASFRPGEHGVSAAAGIALCLVATLCYGVAASYAKKRLAGVPPMAVAGGSQLAAAAMALGPALWWWPATNPGATAWGAAAMLALACTGLAYWMYFRLIGRIGPAKAVSVTFLVPAFAVAWGALFLGEMLNAATVAGCAVILAGTALATGLVGRR